MSLTGSESDGVGPWLPIQESLSTMKPTALIAVVAFGLLATACGDGATSGDATPETSRTIEIEMQDNRYLPDTIDVADGETVRLVFTNAGAVDHDAYIGDEAAQDDHEAEMSGEMGGHDMGDDDGSAVTVKPGGSAELTHTFAAGDGVLIGCHEPGHYGSGMRLTVNVT